MSEMWNAAHKGVITMRVAVCSKSTTLESEVSEVFGRAPYFLIIENDSDSYKVIKVLENAAAKQSSGAGIEAAKIIARENVELVVSGNFGPRAKTVLEQFEIKMVKAKGKVKEILKKI